MEQGLVFFLGVRFLLSGWVTMEVWNVVGQRVRGGGGWPKARSRNISQGPEAQGPQQFSQNGGRGWDAACHIVRRFPRPLLLSGPGGKGDRVERTRESRGVGRGLEVKVSSQVSSSVKRGCCDGMACLIQTEAIQARDMVSLGLSVLIC